MLGVVLGASEAPGLLLIPASAGALEAHHQVAVAHQSEEGAIGCRKVAEVGQARAAKGKRCSRHAPSPRVGKLTTSWEFNQPPLATFRCEHQPTIAQSCHAFYSGIRQLKESHGAPKRF